MPVTRQPAVSIVIKALNEEQRIASAIESALAAVHEIGDGEVILADSASTDRTVEIASRYPITIVQLANPAERSCGAGAQLGYQYARGRFVCLMDGDMRLRRGFLPAAIRRLEHDAGLAGVGGIIVECATGNLEFSQRDARREPDRLPGHVRRLDCGGVYRRSAIESVDYFADRNLHGGEEGDLGARLRSRNWALERIAVPAIDHHGHSVNPYRLLLRRIASRFASSEGEVVRAALGRPHFARLLDGNGSLKVVAVVYGWWAALLACALVATREPMALYAMAALLVLPFAAMSLKYRSLNTGVYSVAAWIVGAICFWPGFLRRRRPPEAWIESRILHEAPARLAGEHLKAG